MTITYPISMPSQPGFKSCRITQMAAVAVSESPFTYEQQVYRHQGQRWAAEMTLPVMRRVLAAQWIASFAAKLNGRQGTFLMGDPDAKVPQGVATGTPLVNGGSQVGNSLITDGWTPSVTGILLPGDYLQLGSGATARMYQVLDAVDSDGSGNATLTIWPNLRGSPADNAALTLTNPVTQWRLDAPFMWSANEVSTFNVSFTASEAL